MLPDGAEDAQPGDSRRLLGLLGGQFDADFSGDLGSIGPVGTVTGDETTDFRPGPPADRWPPAAVRPGAGCSILQVVVQQSLNTPWNSCAAGRQSPSGPAVGASTPVGTLPGGAVSITCGRRAFQPEEWTSDSIMMASVTIAIFEKCGEDLLRSAETKCPFALPGRCPYGAGCPRRTQLPQSRAGDQWPEWPLSTDACSDFDCISGPVRCNTAENGFEGGAVQ